jgi:hypothetical protein
MTMLLLLAFGTTSCAGGSAVPTAHTSAVASGDGTLKFAITIPAKTAANARRLPAYISPSTQSITVAITGTATQTVTANLTPTSSGCSSTLASTVCTLTLALGAGTYNAAVSTFDGANGTGNALSAGQNIGFTIVAGTTNTIDIVLNGIPASLTLVPATTAIVATGGSTSFTLNGIVPGKLQAEALDADGNIIAGVGAPAFSVAQTGGASFTLTNPTSTAPNTIVLGQPATSGQSATYTLTASYPDATCSTSGAICSLNFSVTSHQQVLVASVGSGYEVWQPPYTGTPITLSGVTGSLQLINSAAFDATGNLYVVDSAYNGGAGQILAYAPPYTGSPTSIGAGTISDPTAVVIGPDGKMFVSSFDNSTVYIWTAPYTGSPTAVTTDVTTPSSLALDANEDLFVGNFGGSAALDFATPYTGTPTLLNGTNMTASIHIAPLGEAFLIDIGSNGLLEFLPPYTGTPTTLTNGVNNPEDVAYTGSGTMFVSQPSGVTEFLPPYSAPSTSFPTATGGGVGLAIDAASELFSANYINDNVTVYVAPYTGGAYTTLNTSGTVWDVDLSR